MTTDQSRPKTHRRGKSEPPYFFFFSLAISCCSGRAVLLYERMDITAAEDRLRCSGHPCWTSSWAEIRASLRGWRSSQLQPVPVLEVPSSAVFATPVRNCCQRKQRHREPTTRGLSWSRGAPPTDSIEISKPMSDHRPKDNDGAQNIQQGLQH
jgi:hypothetical protein